MGPQSLHEFQESLAALDYVGVAVFAITGALAAARLRQDFVTLCFFAGMTGMGGGTIRDLLIDAPVFWLNKPLYLMTCIGSAIAVWMLSTNRWPARLLLWLDAIGLSAYCIVGTVKALSYGVSPVTAVLMGAITATFGGILRDVVAGQPSILLQREIYVTAAIVGSTVAVVLMKMTGLGIWPSGLIGAAVALFIRGGAILKGWRLPIHEG